MCPPGEVLHRLVRAHRESRLFLTLMADHPSQPRVTLVSGLPRSGTSLMMQMLAAGGLAVLSDDVRQPDTDNPRGYFEYEPARRTAKDSRWVADAVGKVVKL